MADSSENTAFRDALIAAAESVMPERYDTGGLVEWSIADAILAMPEMEAIKAALDVALECSPLGCPYLLQDGSEGSYGPNTCNQGCQEEPECITHSYPRLPASVVQWVRS